MGKHCHCSSGKDCGHGGPGKDCGNHGDEDFADSCRRLLLILLFLTILAGVAALIIYLVLRPTHPRFYLQDASLRELSLGNGTAPCLSTTAQVTLASRNPNARVGVYYDRLDVSVSYKYQQVTVASRLQPQGVFQGHGDVDVWSPVLEGPGVPFAPFLADALSEDVKAGYLVLQVRIDGRVRWKVGSWVSGHYHIFVTCPAYFVVSAGGGGGGGGYRGGGSGGAHGLTFQTATYCHVEI